MRYLSWSLLGVAALIALGLSTVLGTPEGRIARSTGMAEEWAVVALVLSILGLTLESMGMFELMRRLTRKKD